MLYVNQKLITLLALIILIGSTPPILVALSPIKSFSIGCLIFAVLGILFAFQRTKSLYTIRSRTLLLILLIALYSFLQHIIVGTWQVKSYSSIIPLMIMFLSAYLLSREITHLDNALVLKAFTLGYYFFALLGILNIVTNYTIGKSLGYTHGQPIFPFLEPSHYALYFGPLAFIYITIQSSAFKKAGGILLLIGMSISIPNTTLLTYACLSILMLVFNFRTKTLFLAFPIFITVMIYGTSAVLSNEYFSKRLDVAADSNQNTTTLVYLQGVQDAINSLSMTNGLGLGFQMLGTQPPSEYSYSIAKVMSDVNGELNRQDGGFLGAKIISEFGIIGLGVVLLFGIFCAKSFVRIRKLTRENSDTSKTKSIIFNCIVATFCIEMFVRGYGYFSPGFYLFLVAVFYMANKKPYKHPSTHLILSPTSPAA